MATLTKVLKPILGSQLGNTAKVFGAAVNSQRGKPTYTGRTIPPPAKYGGRHTVALIPGDGIGPELLNHVRELFRFCCVPVDFEVVHVNSASTREDDINNAIMAIRRNGVALKGNIETNHTMPPNHKSRNNLLRTSLDLYANMMHCQSLPGVHTRHKNIDIIIIRENTEGEYSSLEHESVSGVVESLKIITRNNSLRIADYAFRLARDKGRRRVTAVHKANIMLVILPVVICTIKSQLYHSRECHWSRTVFSLSSHNRKLGDGLFLQCCKEVASGYPDIEFDSMIVDNTTMQLVSKPHQFDVMLMPNLYGNVVSNVCAGLVGGPGLVPGANYGRDYAVFETATRNTGKSIANRNIANPTAMLLASCLMLDHLKLHDYANMIRGAILTTMNETRLHTVDIGGQGTTSEVVQSIMRIIQSSGPLTTEI
uniref:Isocitrate dehydrogenase (NAD(+)) 3 non-catalytic subunit gamma n=2 Tax=Cyprinus carpio TaxID=7962 RepID=A0A9J8CVL1_CYPCA